MSNVQCREDANPYNNQKEKSAIKIPLDLQLKSPSDYKMLSSPLRNKVKVAKIDLYDIVGDSKVDASRYLTQMYLTPSLAKVLLCRSFTVTLKEQHRYDSLISHLHQSR